MTSRRIVGICISILAGLSALIVLIKVGASVGWAGFEGKTFWDWLDLWIVPLMLALGALFFNWQARKSERALAFDHQRETALQTYLDRMTELLLEKNLRESDEGDLVRKVARARTLAVLRGLDGRRKGMLVQFLKESNLITKDAVVVKLHDADLTGAYLVKAILIGVELAVTDLAGADLQGAFLSNSDLSVAVLNKADLTAATVNEANLSSAKLERAKLTGAFLLRTNLSGTRLIKANFRRARLVGADLHGADLTGADLTGADLTAANLSYTILSKKQLEKAEHLVDAIMPDGRKCGESSWVIPSKEEQEAA